MSRPMAGLKACATYALSTLSASYVAQAFRPATRRTACIFAIVCMLAPLASAQNMPQASQVHGVPLNTPELATGTVTVRLFRERIGNNVPNHPVSLEGPQGSRKATTDAQGRAEFTGLTPGQTVRVRADVDDEALESQEFQVAAQGGTRVALIAGIAAAAAREEASAAEAAKQPARPGVVVLGNQSRVIIEFQDDELTVFYILDVVNDARTPIDTGEPLVIDLPADASNASLLEGSSRLGSMRNEDLIITGPFPPGSTSLQLAYRLPWRGSSVEFQQAWPVAMDDVFVAVEKVGALTLSSPQLTQQQEGQASGQTFVMGVGPRLNPGQPMTLTLTGLPNRSTWMRDIGIALAFLILAVGLWIAFASRPAAVTPAAPAATQREALFGELVALERKHARGAVDPAFYHDRRGEIILELEQVMTDMERRAPGVSTAVGREGAPA